MPSTGMPSAILASIPAKLGNSCCISRARCRTAGVSSSSRLGGSSTLAIGSGSERWSATENSRISSSSSPKNSSRSGMLGGRREHVEDAAAHRELAAPGHHVDPRVREVDELRRELGEVVAASARDELERLDVGEVVGERLQRRAHGGDEDEWMRRGASRPLREAAQRRDPSPDRLGARAQALVRQGLPRRELDDLRVGHVRLERAAERLALAAGRGDHEHGARGGQQARHERRPESVDEREIGAS